MHEVDQDVVVMYTLVNFLCFRELVFEGFLSVLRVFKW